MVSEESGESLRIDKWLWAARFFKTRSLAADAVSGGKVHVNGQRIKPSRTVHEGDELRIHRGFDEYVVIIKEISARRGPASKAQKLYEETEQSRQQREEMALQRKMNAQMIPATKRRPNKKERRHIIRFTRKDG